MSRCFPFPPPGYERKTRADDPDLPKKQLLKEKQHKKDKKDKEKKEGKEKREKDKSDEKHREKKDKKEKHREKKKDKEKDRDKDKHKTDGNLPNDGRVVGPPEGHVHKPLEKNKDRAGDSNTGATFSGNRAAGVSASQNGEQLRKIDHQVSEPKSFRSVPELGRRGTDEEKRSVSQLPVKTDKAFGSERKRDGVVKLAEKNVGTPVGGKENSKEKRAHDGRLDGRGTVGEARSSGSAVVPNSVGMFQNRVGGMAKPLEKKSEKTKEGKEKSRERETDDRKGEKRKEKDREKPSRSERNREKEKKKEEKVKLTSEQKHVEQPRIKDFSENHMLKSGLKSRDKNDSSVVQSVGLQNTPKESHHGAASHSSLGKRKDVGLNGICDEHNSGPNKLARTMPLAHPLTENGRSSEPCQNSAQSASGVQQRQPMNIKVERTFAPDDTQRPPVNNIKVDGKERKINGIIAQPVAQSSQPTVKTEQATKPERKPEAPTVKPPHPDTKYLGQVLSVPKMDEWSDFVDQEWLFSSSSSRARKPGVQSPGADETPQVWAKALWLEPADIHALPYVIPH